MKFRRACNLERGDLDKLIEPPPTDSNGLGQPGLQQLDTVLSAREKDGYILKQLCLDKDVWVVGERDAVYTIYFSMAKNVGQAVIGVWVLQPSLKTGYGVENLRLSDPVSFAPVDIGNPQGFAMLDLQKRYTGEGRIIPTVTGRVEWPGAANARQMQTFRQTFAFGPKSTRLQKTYGCERVDDTVLTQITKDTCINTID